MNESQKQALHVSLTKHIEGWLEADEVQAITSNLDCLGNEISRTMATAAMAVLEANYKIQEYLRENDLMTDE